MVKMQPEGSAYERLAMSTTSSISMPRNDSVPVPDLKTKRWLYLRDYGYCVPRSTRGLSSLVSGLCT